MQFSIAVQASLQQAFARQASSDFDMYELICRNTGVPGCQKLHYIQMALEKTVKAHLYSTNTQMILDHALVEKHFPTIYQSFWSLSRPGIAILPHLLYNIRQLCQNIDLLCPAKPKAIRQTHPQNSEYPWIDPDTSRVVSPLDFLFVLESMLFSPEFIEIVKCAKHTIKQILNHAPVATTAETTP